MPVLRTVSAARVRAYLKRTYYLLSIFLSLFFGTQS